jgi:phage tail-like protein
MNIWQWRESIVQGKMSDARKNISITMLDRSYKPVGIWHFTNAWPSKVSGPTFKSDDNNFGVEEVTIVHEGMYRET